MIYSITTDTLNIWLDVNDDGSYRLELIERDSKLLYSSKGSWEETSDSIILTGSNCLILDTSTEPDSIIPLEDSLCEAPIPLELPSSENAWAIKTASLTTMLTAFPIPADAFDAILAFLPEIPLEKESD